MTSPTPGFLYFDVKASHVYHNKFNINVQVAAKGGTSTTQYAGRSLVTEMTDPKARGGTPPANEPAARSKLGNVEIAVGGSPDMVTATGAALENLVVGNIAGWFNGFKDNNPAEYHVQFNFGDDNKWYDGEVKSTPAGGASTMALRRDEGRAVHRPRHLPRGRQHHRAGRHRLHAPS